MLNRPHEVLPWPFGRKQVAAPSIPADAMERIAHCAAVLAGDQHSIAVCSQAMPLRNRTSLLCNGNGCPLCKHSHLSAISGRQCGA